MRTILAAIVLAALASTAAIRTLDAQPVFELEGKLYKSVFSAGAGVLAEADVARVPEPLRSRLARYLERRATFRSRYTSQSETLDRMRADAKRRAIERSMVSLVEMPGIEQAAAEFVSKAPIAGEWNGLHTGPIAEAAFAEDVLKKDPASPLAPWFYVFIADRQRIAFEAYENANDEEGMKAAAKKYRTLVERARSVDDPIFPALIEDLDRQPYLYLTSTNHPRDYDPDS